MADVTILDLADRAADPAVAGRLYPTSPRSIDACLRLGIDPNSLAHLPLEHFLRKVGDPTLAQLEFEHHEEARKERLRQLIAERRKLEEESGLRTRGARPGTAAAATARGGSPRHAALDMVEREAKRLEVMRRRQEKELGQLISYELMRKEMQEKAEAKVRMMEQRAEEQRRAKKAHDEEWQRQQHEREIQRKREEEALERELKIKDSERYKREMEQLQREEEEEKQRRKLAYEREQERLAKAEQARLETERILREQQEEVERRKALMEKRDAEREEAKLVAAEERAKFNAEQQRQAQVRIAAALKANKTLMQRKRDEYEARQRQNEERRRQRAEARRLEEETKAAREAEEAEKRRAAYAEAQRKEQARVSEITRKQREKDEELARLRAERDAENARRALERKLQLEDKVLSVEELKRRDAYQRSQALKRIEEETAKARDLLDQRRQLQEQRRQANMEASFQRQKIVEAMDKLQRTKSWGVLDDAAASGGTVSIDSLLKK
eukprot:scaffold13.g402.t1